MHQSNQLQIDDDNDAYRCLECERDFVSEEALLSHCQYATVHRGAFCEDCPFLASTPQALCDHVNTALEHNWSFCKRCSRSFDSYNAHFEHLAHSGRHWLCFKCGQDLENGAELVQHLVKIHCHCYACGVNFGNCNQHFQEVHSKADRETFLPAPPIQRTLLPAIPTLQLSIVSIRDTAAIRC